MPFGLRYVLLYCYAKLKIQAETNIIKENYFQMAMPKIIT